MGAYDRFKNFFAKETTSKPAIGLKQAGFALFAKGRTIVEAAKGLIQQAQQTVMSSKLGDPHPIKFEILAQVYSTTPIIHGAINKMVDFSVGPGFRIKSENENAVIILEAFMDELDFDNLLRRVIKDMLVYGNAYLEIVAGQNGAIEQLIPRNPETMFVKRDNKGVLEKYVQSIGLTNDPIDFKPNEIAHFKLTQDGDCAYGQSIITPLLLTVERVRSIERDAVKLVKRKAGAPYDITVGTEDSLPTQEDINSVLADLESLQVDQEWAHGPHVKIDSIGFKDKVMELTPYLDYFENQLVYGLEVPIVLLGKANVPEGLAAAQKDAFERKITSIQLAAESVIEKQIFTRVLESHKITAKVEFEWKEPTQAEKMAEVTTLNQLVGTGGLGVYSEAFLDKIEGRLADLLGFEGFEPGGPKLLGNPAPLPGQNADKTQLSTTYLIKEAFDTKLYDAPLTEFVGFNYAEYLKKIHSFIDSPDFAKREFEGFKYVPGTSQEEWEAVIVKYSLAENLTDEQIAKLRAALHKAFDEGMSVRALKNDIAKTVRPEALQVKVPEVRDETGKLLRRSYTMNVTANTRAWALARTETIRASNQGILDTFSELGVKEVQWVATPDGRVCAYCEAQDGTTLSLDDAYERIPSHDLCRCTWISIKG